MKDHNESEYGSELPEAASWSQDRRLKFIDFRLRWEGRVNRGDLMDFFGISAPQASADLGKYAQAAPENIDYDLKLKSYVRMEGFTPVYPRSASRAYLNELLALTTEVIEPAGSFIGWRPEVGIAPTPSRTFDGRVLSILLHAIREQLQVRVAYQGMKRPEPVERDISPHALGFDGFRWHVRAFCHERKRYQDFVIGRMTNVVLGLTSDRKGADDVEWRTMLTLVIAPHPRLPAGAKRAIRMEYGMVDGTLHLPCRQALLFYALHRLGLQAEHDSQESAAVQQIVLLNRAELTPYFTSQGKGGGS